MRRQITSNYWQSPREDKRFFDCDRFKLKPAHVAFALRHARQVSQQYRLDDFKVVSLGCHSDVVVLFKNGDRVAMDLEPTGKIFEQPQNGRGANRSFFYVCRPCEETNWFDDPLDPATKQRP